MHRRHRREDVLGVAGGQLFTTTSSGTAGRFFAVGTGLPTTAGQTLTSVAGFPLTGGMIGKFYVFSAAYEAGWWWLVVIGVVATAVSTSRSEVTIPYFKGAYETPGAKGAPWRIPMEANIPIITMSWGLTGSTRTICGSRSTASRPTSPARGWRCTARATS